MGNAEVFQLREPGEIDPTKLLTGPLRALRRIRLAPGEEKSLTADGHEFTAFVLSGSGTGHPGSAEIPLHHGVSLTAPLHTGVRIVAGESGLEFFLAELAVPVAREDS